MSIVFLFIDGVGLGAESPENPFTQNNWPGFNSMAGGQDFTIEAIPVQEDNHFFAAVDATLGVEGLPQSGTGQATLFSGENAAQKIGKHFGPFPHSGTKSLLKEKSLFIKAQQSGKSCSFINAYPDIFFKKAKERNRWSCTTLMAKSAGISLNSTEEVRNETAITAGITQQAWRSQLGIDVPEITPVQAARRLLNEAQKYDLLLHEYYLSDKAGHSQEHEKANSFIGRYDLFLQEIIKAKPGGMTLVLCSDHGNVEDLSTKTHTLNKVPLFVKGPGAHAFRGAKSIMDVTPGILQVFDL